MKIVVLVKSVPDTESKIKIGADGVSIDPAGIKFVMNPYDEYAVEEALRIRERLKDDTTVVAISMGPDRVMDVLRTALAMGADDAVHVNDPAFAGGDALGDARVLAEAIRPLGADLILGGKQGIDDDAATTCAAIAEFLGIPQAQIVTELTLSDDHTRMRARRRIEGADEIVDMALPAIVTCEKGLNEPRYASLPGIMKAKKKEIRKVTLADLPLKPEQVGAAGCLTKLIKYHTLPERPPVKMIPGDAAAQAKELVRLLREEAKVI
ncbi:MAG TPA: electron transfer flavoprotein subunit beta/FixA family protein [Candidatus Krumholzibacteria bacterium]|nr:electron transfer flavoprotein subunit beta/FixA family protein [Candidatus Krumholzibacteria bacterium]